jgi:hypothetical protein
VQDEKGFWVANRKNIPAFKEEPRMPPEDQVIPWMLLQSSRVEVVGAEGFFIQFTFKDPNNPPSYWAAVGTENKAWYEFMTKEDKEVKRIATEVTASATTPDAKLDKLYEYCQTQIRNTSFDPTLTDDDRKNWRLTNPSAMSSSISMVRPSTSIFCLGHGKCTRTGNARGFSCRPQRTVFSRQRWPMTPSFIRRRRRESGSGVEIL